jgi:AcrR family transcriptional regulator
VARTQTERREASKRKVLDAAAVLIAQRGSSAAVGMAEIAERAGCASGLPSYLFGTKTELLAALVGDLLGRFRADVLTPEARAATGGDAVVATTRAFLRTLHHPLPHTRALYVLLGEAMGDDRLRAVVNDHHARLRAGVAEWLVEEGLPAADAAAKATVVVGMLRGIGYQVLSDAGAVDVDAVTDAAVALLLNDR